MIKYFSLHRTLISSPGTFGRDFIEDSQQLKGFRFLSKSGITHPNWDLWAEKWRSLKKTRMLPRVRRAFPCTKTALPLNHSFFSSSDANHAPIHSLHGAQNHPLRSLKTISDHWWWTIPSTVHVDTAVSDLSRCCCRPICCTMCCFEITCFTCIDLVIVHKEAIRDKAKDHFGCTLSHFANTKICIYTKK